VFNLRDTILKGVYALMRFDRRRFDGARLATVVIVLLGYVIVAGCNPEGTASAPKLKGSKDEIQKTLQSGGAKPDTGAKRKKN
jgi:hypothetical protein